MLLFYIVISKPNCFYIVLLSRYYLVDALSLLITEVEFIRLSKTNKQANNSIEEKH